MRRRSLLVASFSLVTGCTATGYRATGPRTPPPAPETDTSTAAPIDPVEARAQAVIRPLNELYRLVRGPLGGFDLADITTERLDNAESSLTRAREALAAFSQEVPDPPPRYQSLSEVVTAHEYLLEGLVGGVECWSALSRLDSGDSPRRLLETARSARGTLTTAAERLRATADEEPTVPAAVFLTAERLRGFTVTLETQSTVARRLVDASYQTVEGVEDWRAATSAFERDAFDDARMAFDAARVHYRAAVDALDGVTDAEGSFADLVEARSCVAEAGVDATAVGFDAVDAAAMSDVARAERLLERAKTTRIRCAN